MAALAALSLLEVPGDDDHTQHDGDGNLEGRVPGGEGGSQLLGERVVGAPEDAAAGNEREVSADQEDGAGALLADREHDGEQRHDECAGEGGSSDAELRVAVDQQVGDPAEHAHQTGAQVEFARHAEEDGEGQGAHQRRQGLCRKTGGLGGGKGAVELDDAADKVAVNHKGHAGSQRDAEEHHQRIHKTGGAGEVILVGQVSDAVGEGDARHQQNQGAGNHVAQVLSESETMERGAEGGSHQAAEDVAQHLGEVGHADGEDEDPEQDARHHGRRAVEEAAAEHRAESAAAQRRADELFPDGLAAHRADGRDSLQGFVKGAAGILDIPGKLVHRDDLVKAGPFDGNVLHAGIGVAGGDDAVAHREEVLGTLTVIGGDAFHRFIHTGYLRAVFQKDLAGFRGKFQHLAGAGGFRVFHRAYFLCYKVRNNSELSSFLWKNHT